jgi:hypothetical protein
MFSAGWWSSPSMNGNESDCEMAFPTVDFPHPAGPAMIIKGMPPEILPSSVVIVVSRSLVFLTKTACQTPSNGPPVQRGLTVLGNLCHYVIHSNPPALFFFTHTPNTSQPALQQKQNMSDEQPKTDNIVPPPAVSKDEPAAPKTEEPKVKPLFSGFTPTKTDSAKPLFGGFTPGATTSAWSSAPTTIGGFGSGSTLTLKKDDEEEVPYAEPYVG